MPGPRTIPSPVSKRAWTAFWSALAASYLWQAKGSICNMAASFPLAIVAPRSTSEWAAEQARLLALEHEEEVNTVQDALAESDTAALEARGTTLTCLKLVSTTVGLLGRTEVMLVHREEEGPLPPHKFSPGSVVGLVDHKVAKAAGGHGSISHAATGVVFKVTDRSIRVSLREQEEEEEGRGGVQLHGERVRMDALPNDVTHKRISAALAAVKAGAFGPAARMARALFPWAGATPRKAASEGDAPQTMAASFSVNPDDLPRVAERAPFRPFHGGLNASQTHAVSTALAAQDIAVVHGPPGTGKTTTVVEIIRQCVARGQRVLACAPSNVAVDNLLERLVEVRLGAADVARGRVASRPDTYAGGDGANPHVVRIGHPARVAEDLVGYTLDAVVAGDSRSQVVADARGALDGALKDLRRAKRSQDKVGMRDARHLAKSLRRELRERESDVTSAVLRGADVVLATIPGAASRVLQRAVAAQAGSGAATGDGGGEAAPFDVVVIDEAAQSTEAAAWIPLMLGRRAVLAGDHMQLPPTIMSQQAAQGGLGYTLVDRVVAMYDSRSTSPAQVLLPERAAGLVTMLDTQYRMHAAIGAWSSTTLYGGGLHPHASVAGHTLPQLPSVASVVGGGGGGLPPSLRVGDVDVDVDTLSTPIVILDTAGCDCPEVAGGGHASAEAGASRASGRALLAAAESKRNPGEVEVVHRYVTMLLAAGLAAADIAVITPYNAQVAALKERFSGVPGLEVRSVDGYQGQEKEAVVLSLVRSNPTRTVGFLSDFRRLNVAVTRARRQVVIIGDSDTVCADPHIASLFAHAEEAGEVQTAAVFLGMDVAEAPPVAQAALPELPPAAPPSEATTTPPPTPPSTKKTRQPLPQLGEQGMDALLTGHVRALLGCTMKLPAGALRGWCAPWVEAHPLPAQPGSTPLQQPEADIWARCISLTSSLCNASGGSAEALASISRVVQSLTAQVLTAVLPHCPPADRAKVEKGLLPAVMVCPDTATPSLVLAYPVTATSFLRARGHQAAEKAAVHHMSLTLGKPVRGRSRKRLLITAVPTSIQSKVQPAPAPAPTPAPLKTAPTRTSRGGGRSTGSAPAGASPGNSALGALAAERRARAAARGAAKAPGATTVARQAANGWTSRETTRSVEEVAAVAAAAAGAEEDEDMALLDAMVEATQRRCGRSGCDANTVTGSVCRLCKLRYCFKHGMPESHGCGEAARKAARAGTLAKAAAMSADRTAIPGAGKKLSGNARSAVLRQLHKKLDAATAERSGAGAGDKKKKGKKKKGKR